MKGLIRRTEQVFMCHALRFMLRIRSYLVTVALAVARLDHEASEAEFSGGVVGVAVASGALVERRRSEEGQIPHHREQRTHGRAESLGETQRGILVDAVGVVSPQDPVDRGDGHAGALRECRHRVGAVTHSFREVVHEHLVGSNRRAM